MNRIDNSKFLLYIEPKKEDKLLEPINDNIVDVMKLAISKSIEGAANYSKINEVENFIIGDGWMGCHITDCGVWSENNDYLLENGMITNSLCIYYLQYYRHVIPQSEMDKVNKLVEYYK